MSRNLTSKCCQKCPKLVAEMFFNAGDEIEILGKKEFFGQLQLQGVLEGKITSI